jgi:predicted RNA methylase
MPEFTTEAIEVLKNSRVEGTVVKLPDGQLDRKVYTEVKNKLELIGGKWKGGKVYGFQFQEDPTDLLNEIANGGNRNLKKEFQFFATPDSLADYLVELAFTNSVIDDEPMRILEPSAGQGAIVKAINRRTGGNDVCCYEAMPVNQAILNKISTVVFLGEDFLQAPEDVKYDCIIANPPFTKNADIDHIKKMYSVLAKGGRLVTISSKSWQIGTQKKQLDFKNWLNEVDADIEEIEPGAFKESGTSVGGLIITISY